MNMKLTTKLVGVSALVLLGVQTSQAATVAPGNDKIPTNGTITFNPNTTPTELGEVHQPDELGETPSVIELENQGSQGSGNLRIQFVPDFKFGSHDKITAGAVTETVTLMDYHKKGESTKSKIAPFVQVTDERGKAGDDAYWTLSVVATPFTAEIAPGKTDVLANCEIQLNESTLTMDYKTSQEAASFIQGQAADASIKADGTQVVEVLKTVSGQSTNGTNVSNVFLNNYTKDMTYASIKNSGVTFYKPAGQAPLENVEYTSTLNWTLTTGL